VRDRLPIPALRSRRGGGQGAAVSRWRARALSARQRARSVRLALRRAPAKPLSPIDGTRDRQTRAGMTERKSQLDTVAVCSLLLCSVLWGLNHVATKVTLAEVPPLMQASARSLGGALLVALWARARGIPLLDRDGTLVGGLLAGTLFAAEFACIFIGLQFTAASRMVVFIYLAPFVVALGMPFIARAERLSALQLGGLLAAFAGVASAFAEG